MLPQNVDIPVAFTVGTPLLSASWRIRGPVTSTLGEGNGVLQDWQQIDLNTQTVNGQIILTVPAQLNLITTTVSTTNATNTVFFAPAIREARIVDLLTTIAGLPTTLTSVDYTIVSDQSLVLMQNSFQDYSSACEYASEIFPLNGWQGSTADQRLPALMQAFQALSRLNYEIYYDVDDVYFRNRASYGLPYINTIGRLYNYSASDFQALDPDFQMKIQRAQVIQADYILGGNPVEEQRQSGILSATTGQSSHMFRSTKPLYFGVCRACLQELSGYLKYSVGKIRS